MPRSSPVLIQATIFSGATPQRQANVGGVKYLSCGDKQMSAGMRWLLPSPASAFGEYLSRTLKVLRTPNKITRTVFFGR